MSAELLALSAAFGWALAGIAVKFATQTDGGVVVGLLITLASSIVTLAVLAVVTVENWTMPVGAVALFAVAGLAGPGAGRILLIRGVRDAGTSVAIPVYASAYPLVGSVAGVAVFGEGVGLRWLFSLGLILSGIWACVNGGSANRDAVTGRGDVARAPVPRSWVLVVPVAAGGAFATMDVLTKLALGQQADPVLGALVGMVMAFVAWLLVLAWRSPQEGGASVRISPSFGWYCVNGFLAGLAQVCLLLALRTGDLSVVTPIVASQPVIVLALGAVLLRNLERLRVSTVMGGLIVAVGVASLSMVQ